MPAPQARSVNGGSGYARSCDRPGAELKNCTLYIPIIVQ